MTEARHKMNLIIDHQSEFPSRIREAIRAASDRTPFDFLSEVRKAVKAFLFGRSSIDDNSDNESDDDDYDSNKDEEPKPPFHWWHGPNSDVDTEEEVETAIRFFPSVLREKHYHPRFPRHRLHFPISVLFSCSRSMPFIPLLAEVGTELGTYATIHKKLKSIYSKKRGGLKQSIFIQLIYNRFIRDDLDEESSGKLDELSTAIMMRLKEKVLMVKEEIYGYDLTNLLLYNANYGPNYRYDQRLRFLMDWDPSILAECGRNNPLLYHYVHRLCSTDGGKIPRNAIQRFGTILEFGMSHYPNELGFLFHRSTLLTACENFGSEEVSRIIDEKLSVVLGQRHNQNRNRNESSNADTNNNSSGNSSTSLSLQAMMFAAATNDKISINGVYTLFRRDPMALLPQGSLQAAI
eukprot:CAMPEP_0194187164 /NCGR_PEP_ID=MMETSP0154-20130528/49755_1 /TAXON_ID=1049557 /ORGANISM="Thalassiothrix antarctica, Strain L6-D1" /LENGTH=405 /DNA_ID=CAMNT_0038906687 /DNA_START=24 /DNA_END=1241 /DNA_ORIENTATION=-